MYNISGGSQHIFRLGLNRQPQILGTSPGAWDDDLVLVTLYDALAVLDVIVMGKAASEHNNTAPEL